MTPYIVLNERGQGLRCYFRAYGGWQGRLLRYYSASSLDAGGGRVASLGWTPETIKGVVASDCASSVEEEIDLQTAAGHHSDTQRAVMDAAVTAITGSVSVSAGGSNASASFIPNGDTTFTIPVATGQAVHSLTIEADLTASLPGCQAAPGPAHPPPRAYRADRPNSGRGASRGQRQRQRDGDVDLRRRNHGGAHHLGLRLHPQQGLSQRRDSLPPGRSAGREALQAISDTGASRRVWDLSSAPPPRADVWLSPTGGWVCLPEGTAPRWGPPSVAGP